MLPYLLRSMMKLSKLIILGVLMSLCWLCRAQGQDTITLNYPVELMKHYITSEEYDLALETADMYLPVNAKADSLTWLSAYIYKNRQDFQAAAEAYTKVIEISQDSLLVTNSADNLIILVPKLESRAAIDLLVAAVKKVKDNINYQRLIMKLANLYENNYLYSEANDIYTIILESELDFNERDLYIKIATNKVFEKKYHEAVEYADKAGAAIDSVLSAEALFIEFLSFQALGKNDQALPPLIKLYNNFPEFAGLFEINLNLADLLLKADEKLAAWYVLEKFYPSANKLEKELILDKIKEVVDSINIDPGRMNSFDNLNLNFDSLIEQK